jgi:tetratricopeptide (TPR) repeat protein
VAVSTKPRTFFTRAQEEASNDNDMATVGRCSNNLGIIASMQGDYKRAVINFTRAIASYEQAHFARGVAEARHNLGIACSGQGRLDRALETATLAIQEAEKLADAQLTAQAIAGLAEIHVARGEAEQALQGRGAGHHHAPRAEVIPWREAEDARIKGWRARSAGPPRGSRNDPARGHQPREPSMAVPCSSRWPSATWRTWLLRAGDTAAGKAAAQRARSTFQRLSARAEIAKLDEVLETP